MIVMATFKYDQEKCRYLYNIDHHLMSQARARAKLFVLICFSSIFALIHKNLHKCFSSLRKIWICFFLDDVIWREGTNVITLICSCDPNLVLYSVLVKSMDC